MNHYQRLKVSPDAPPEVIRAAYRALASRLHPDRDGAVAAAADPLDERHAQMAALNAAYEVLIDPKLRQDYDATLAPAHLGTGLVTDMAPAPFAADAGARHAAPASPQPVASKGWQGPFRALLWGGLGLMLVSLGVGVWTWRFSGQSQMERALSEQYADRMVKSGAALPDEALAPPPLAPVPPAARRADPALPVSADPMPSPALSRKPTVQELARMSDEELLKALPALDAPAPSPTAAARANPSAASLATARRHLLDGQPMSLRVDTQLVDPLAPEPTAASRKP